MDMSDDEKIRTQLRELTEQLRERDEYIASIRHDMAMLERSVVWKAVRAWASGIDHLFPLGSRARSLYDACIHGIQNCINEKIPRAVFFLLKKRQLRESADAAHSTFKTHHADIDVLVVTHEESRTGAPLVTCEVARRIKKNNSVAFVSLARGTLTDDIEHEFGPVFRPHESLPRALHANERAQATITFCAPRAVYASSLTSLPYARAAKQAGIPTTFHIHELKTAFELALTEHERSLIKDSADTFIVPTHQVKDILVHEYACDAKSIIVVPSSIPLQKNKDLSAALRKEQVDREIGGDASSPIILAVGTFNFRKGADIFVEMAEILARTNVSARCVWLGGKLPAKDPVSIHLKHRERSFTFLHERKNPYPYIAHAHIVVLPSREDTMPLSALEAVALGIPVVCFSESGGTAYALKDACSAVSGFGADALASDITRLLSDTGAYEQMRQACTTIAPHFEMELHIPVTCGIVERSLTKHKTIPLA